MKQPGVMIYFNDIRPSMRTMSDEQFVKLMRGLIDFAETGTVPEFDGMEQIVFDMIRPRVEHDIEKYQDTVWKRKYAVYVREADKSGITALSFADWYEQMTSHDIT